MVYIKRTYSLIIIGRILCENPFFVPPDEFERECGSGADLAKLTPELRTVTHDRG